MRYTRLLAHGNEMGTAPSTTMASGMADQMPMTLCQLKSRARAGNPPRNHSTWRNCTEVHRRGTHK
jgi:hypothetical protein